jgi:hypothetical protein
MKEVFIELYYRPTPNGHKITMFLECHLAGRRRLDSALTSRRKR